MKSNSYIDFSIIIPAWNESAMIVNAVTAAKNAIEQQKYNGSIVVVDNNSTDDTAEKARIAGANIVFEPVNQIARARNTGARTANTDWLVFVDADTTISPGLLTLALDALASGEVIGGGSTVAPDREISNFGAIVLGFWNWVSVKSKTAAGCFIYCQRDAFEAIGGFSNKVFAGEELLLSRQLKRLAKTREQRFVIQTKAPVVTSARKLEWYTPAQMVIQFLILLIPGTTYSKTLCRMWYVRK